MEKFGIKSESQIITWVRENPGRWTDKHFSSAEEEKAYLKAQVEYQKRSIRICKEREAGFRSPVAVHSRNKQVGTSGVVV